MRLLCLLLCAAPLAPTIAVVAGAQARAVGQPAVEAVIGAFRSHQVVCLGEGTHRSVQDLQLRLAILQDPRFPRLVHDIVVEMGNSKYQATMDRFVSGEEVSDSDLRLTWENAVPADTVADSPVYEALYRGVREINSGLAPGNRLRVLLGDPPIDWEAVQTTEDLGRWDRERDRHAADLIRREVLAKERRALVLYGAWHCARANERTNYTTADSLVALLEASGDGPLYSIRTMGREDADLRTADPDIGRWTRPSLTVLDTTTIGALEYSTLIPADPRVEYRNGVRTVVGRPEWRTRRFEQQFDAAIYLGPPSTITEARLDPARCRDERYIAMRTRRMALALGIMPGTTGTGPIAQLLRYCAVQPQ
jgi:hypothetical protein